MLNHTFWHHSRKFNRRDFFKTAFVSAAAPLLLRTTAHGQSSRSARPNILLIMADDMGYSDIGCYGGEIHTPTLDRLAANGLRFSQFYNTARCAPTRASLLTGLYPHQAGIGLNPQDQGHPGYRGGLNDQCVTLAEVLKQTGYSTYMVGKWHVVEGHNVFQLDREGSKHNWPLQRGFDRFYGTIAGAGSFYDPTTLTRGNTPITPENDPEYNPELFYYTDAINDNAVRFLKDHQHKQPNRPFFMYVSHTAPHWPMHAKPKDIDRYRGRYDLGYEPIRRRRYQRLRQMGLIQEHWQVPEQVGDWDNVRHKEWEARCMEVYAAMVDSLDQGIGKIVAELERQNKLDNTLILFLSDNGGCAEGFGRGGARWDLDDVAPLGPDEFQTRVRPPMQTRDGRVVRGGTDVMPGPEDTYIAYGRDWANVSNTPFREYKHWVHEGGIATPLVVHWPAGIHDKNALRHCSAHVIDLMPTFLEIAGATYPKTYNNRDIQPMEGVSLLPAFADQPLQRQALHWEHNGNRAIRMGKWKLVSRADDNHQRWSTTDTIELDQWELFDLEKDRAETDNIASLHPQRVRRMAQLWQDWAKRTNVLPKPH